MGKILVKETITKEREIEITVDTLLALIDDLALKEKFEREEGIVQKTLFRFERQKTLRTYAI